MRLLRYALPGPHALVEPGPVRPLPRRATGRGPAGGMVGGRLDRRCQGLRALLRRRLECGGAWGLTEQLFRDVVVVTSRDTRQRHHVLQEMPFLVTRRRPEALEFGVRTVWRGQTKVPVSDPSRTLVDGVRAPRLRLRPSGIATEGRVYYRGPRRTPGPESIKLNPVGRRASDRPASAPAGSAPIPRPAAAAG